MLRRNPTSGAWERREGNAWVPANPPAGAPADSLDAALGDAFSDADQGLPAAGDPVSEGSAPGPATATAEPVTGAQLDVVAGHDGAGVSNGAIAGAGELAAGDANQDSLAHGDALDLDVPGLTSGDGSKGTAGQKSVRERLSGLKNRKVQRSAQVIAVGPRSARAVGPAVKDSTSARQTAGSKKTVVVGIEKQRYANRPAPGIFDGRPQWVKELFEAHFRSEQALEFRKSFGRMKISRMDYAIGWLVAFDKIRAEPAILRLRDKSNGAQ